MLSAQVTPWADFTWPGMVICTTQPAIDFSSASPAIVIEIAQPIKALLQVLRAVALLVGCASSRHKAAPLEMRLGIVAPGRASQAAAKAPIGFRLHDGDARVDFARSTLAFDIASLVVASKAKRKAAAGINADALGYGRTCHKAHQ
jgi:hypothetical protein